MFNSYAGRTDTIRHVAAGHLRHAREREPTDEEAARE